MSAVLNVSIKANTAGKADLSKALKRLKRSSVYVGIPRRPGDRQDGPCNSDRAWIHEKGSSDGRIPPRPFLVPSVTEQKQFIAGKFKAAAKAALAGDDDACDMLLESCALTCAAKVKEYILESDHFVPNAPSTLRRKAPKDKPLIDSGAMLGSVTAFVVKE